jgi:hemolysin III
MNSKKKKIRKAEEIVNSASHGVGVMLAIAATVLLIVRGAMHGNAWHIVTYSIFGAGLINLYTASTLYHGAINPRKKFNLNKFDHSSIYVLIAATYTPFAILAIKGWQGCHCNCGSCFQNMVLLPKASEIIGLALRVNGLGSNFCINSVD